MQVVTKPSIISFRSPSRDRSSKSMSRSLAVAAVLILLLAAAAVAPPALAADVSSIAGANEFAGVGAAGANELAGAAAATESAVGADPEPSPVGGIKADPAPDAHG
ncbi:hypothetical protein ACP70R_007023 [Stipagrostis hirtigluma subsp. patula]